MTERIPGPGERSRVAAARSAVDSDAAPNPESRDVPGQLRDDVPAQVRAAAVSQDDGEVQSEEAIDALWRQFVENPTRSLRDRLLLHYAPLVKYVEIGRASCRGRV